MEVPEEVRAGFGAAKPGLQVRECLRRRRSRRGERDAGGRYAFAVGRIFFAPTHYAGAFLLIPEALEWLSIAERCFADEHSSLRRGLLTSVFAVLTGMERIFHLDQMEDVGFAFLTGGRRCPSRHLVGGWRRHLTWYEVDRFCRRTSPWHWVHGKDALVSFDEHTIPRWTHKFSVPKGFITTRNKYMRCEKLYYGYDVVHDRYLSVRGTPGKVELRDVSLQMIEEVLTRGGPRHFHALFDAGAGKSDADVRALFDLAERTPSLDVTVRACRYPSRVNIWKALPAEEFVAYEEDGACEGASPKEIRLAETRTTLKDENDAQAVRTIVCREVVPGPKKDRWHPLYTTTHDEPLEVLQTFRTRQHHEQGYRVGVHDEHLNAVPCGYDKESPDRRRPRFHRGPLQMVGWLAALVYNAVGDLAAKLPERYHGAHVSTLRRTFFNLPGQLYLTSNTLIVQFDRFAEQEALTPVIDSLNHKSHRLPWLDGRRLVLSLTPSGRARAGPVWCHC